MWDPLAFGELTSNSRADVVNATRTELGEESPKTREIRDERDDQSTEATPRGPEMARGEGPTYENITGTTSPPYPEGYPRGGMSEAQTQAIREILAYALAALTLIMIFILVWTFLLRRRPGERRQEPDQVSHIELGTMGPTSTWPRTERSDWTRTVPTRRERIRRGRSPSRGAPRRFSSTVNSITASARRPWPPGEEAFAQIRRIGPPRSRDWSPPSAQNTGNEEPQVLPPFPVVNVISDEKENTTGICNATFKSARM